MHHLSKPRLLCVWEQGSNLGHLSQLRLPIEVALGKGYEVFLAARELHNIDLVLGDLHITVLQAPFKQQVAAADQASFLSYTHLLARQCFSSEAELDILVRAWHAVFELVRPAIVVFDHSPTALVAALGHGFSKILLGSGFMVPPLDAAMASPFLPFPTTSRTDVVLASLRADDVQLLTIVNAVLQRRGVPALKCLGEIYAQAHAQFLVTWPALDHFGERSGVAYLGVQALDHHPAPQWPVGPGPKVFGYLQNFAALEHFLRDLRAAGACALLYVRGLPSGLRQLYSSPNLSFTDRLVDLQQVANQADWVVHHGNHSTMSTFMLAGVPQLLIPRHQEQLFAALRLVRRGCAAMAFQDQPAFSAAIQAVQTNAQLMQSAQKLAGQCAPFDAKTVADFMSQTYDLLLREIIV